MLSDEQIARVKQALADGLKRYEISKRYGVGYGTINRIKRGTYERKKYGKPKPGTWHPDKPKTRCEGCGALVIQPCLACAIRAESFATGMLEAIKQNRFRARRNLVSG